MLVCHSCDVPLIPSRQVSRDGGEDVGVVVQDQLAQRCRRLALPQDQQDRQRIVRRRLQRVRHSLSSTAAGLSCPPRLLSSPSVVCSAVVCCSVDVLTNEVVAIKVIDLEAADEEIEEIRSEIAVLSECQSPHITRYVTSYTQLQCLHIVMEHLGGGSVRDLLGSGAPLEEAVVCVITRELLQAVCYLHDAHLIHRDIKAANILLSDSGQPKLADFGVTGSLTATLQRRRTFVGTPYWMAPEVIAQSAYNEKADVWSLGITVIEMAQGEPPHHQLHPMKALFLIDKAEPPTLSENTGCSRAMREFVALCCQKREDARPSARELLKHRWIKAGKRGVSVVKEAMLQRRAEAELQVSDDEDADGGGGEEEEDWDFTVKQTPTASVRRKDSDAQQQTSTGTLRAAPASQQETVKAASASRPPPLPLSAAFTPTTQPTSSPSRPPPLPAACTPPATLREMPNRSLLSTAPQLNSPVTIASASASATATLPLSSPSSSSSSSTSASTHSSSAAGTKPRQSRPPPIPASALSPRATSPFAPPVVCASPGSTPPLPPRSPLSASPSPFSSTSSCPSPPPIPSRPLRSGPSSNTSVSPKAEDRQQFARSVPVSAVVTTDGTPPSTPPCVTPRTRRSSGEEERRPLQQLSLSAAAALPITPAIAPPPASVPPAAFSPSSEAAAAIHQAVASLRHSVSSAARADLVELERVLLRLEQAQSGFFPLLIAASQQAVNAVSAAGQQVKQTEETKTAEVSTSVPVPTVRLGTAGRERAGAESRALTGTGGREGSRELVVNKGRQAKGGGKVEEGREGAGLTIHYL